MRIEAIDTFIAGHWLFVAVTTESGITGIGESTYFTHPRAVAATIEDLKPELIGAAADRPEFHLNRLIRHHCLRDCVLMSALSALDQALWDIKGKALGVPVWQLLGGRVRDKVRAILLIEAQTEAEILARAQEAVQDGFTAIKIKPFLAGWSEKPAARLMTDAVAIVSHVRESIGWDIDLAIEIHRNLTPDLAPRFAADIAPLRPYFIEDPILPFSLSANAHVAARMGGTVALAERNFDIWEFRDLSDCQDIAILRPDIGMAGGFTQLKKIAAIAESRHQRLVPHNFTSPVATAGHVQLAACTTNWDVQGYVRETREPWNRVVKSINRIERGFLEIPERPGSGIELDFDYLRGAAFTPFGTKFLHQAARAMDGGVRHW